MGYWGWDRMVLGPYGYVEQISVEPEAVVAREGILRPLICIAFPSIGLATYAKNIKQSIGLTLSGTLISAVAGYGLTQNIHDRGTEIFDYPKTTLESAIDHDISEAWFIGWSAATPLGQSFNSHTETRVSGEDYIYSIDGDDIIYFEKGEYKLNFPDNRTFCTDMHSGSRECYNVDRERKNLAEAERLIDEFRGNGDINSLRNSRDLFLEAEGSLAEAESTYGIVKEAFTGVVSLMNDELSR